MLDGRKRGQIALEFLIVYSLVLLIFVIIFALVINQRAASLGQDEYQSLQLAAQNIAIHMDQAIIAGNGYSAIVPIPPVTSENPYKLFISTSGVVEANITIGITKAEAIAYSSARNLVINGTAVASSNGVTLYNVSTYTGSIEITNANGAIYIDELPPSTSFLADSMYLKNEGITKGASFNGSSGSVYVPSIMQVPQNSITITGWIDITNFTSKNGVQSWWTQSGGANAIGLQEYPNQYPGASSSSFTFFLHNSANSGYDCSSGSISINQWYFVSEVVNGTNAQLYVDGTKACSFSYSFPGIENYLTIGAYSPGTGQGAGAVMDGYETNIQLYSTPLSSNQIITLYNSGIGGNPITNAALVGWWPLDGNTNDYSGNGNNGVPYNIGYENIAQIGTSATLTNGRGASHALVGIYTNSGNDSISPEYITQPNTNYIAGVGNDSGNATVFLTSNTPIHSISGQAFLFNGNSSTAANLRGWWPLEESTGNKVYDFSGYFNAGSFTKPNWQPLHETSTAFKVAEFDGSSYDNATTAETYSRGITISAWINNTGTGAYWQNIAEVSGGPYTSEAFGIGVTGANGQAVARWNNQAGSFSGGSSNAPEPAGGIITANTPYLVTGVWNGANNTITVYVNGNPVATSPGNGTYAVAIGKINIGGAYAGMNPFNGRISNVQVYNTSLQQSYIKEIYQNGIDGAPINNVGLVGWFPLDGEPNDYSANNYPTSSSNIAYYNVYNVSAVAGVTNGASAASFNGSGSASSISIPPLKVLNGHHSYSINTWLEYRGGSQYFGQNPFPIGWPGCHMGFDFSGTSTVNFFEWYTSNANNPPGCPTSGSGITPTGASILPNVLYMLTGTYNASTGKLSFYVNGQYYSNATIPSGDYLSNYTETGYIGDALDGNTATKFFNGSVADLQIYNISLTPYEIKQLYANGLPPAKGFNFSVG